MALLSAQKSFLTDERWLVVGEQGCVSHRPSLRFIKSKGAFIS
ncbi:hypothetical protein BN890_9100 [Bacteroides xylanisolvens SD CC 1b]|uniref:Uncharacterized protein n=1 Tax=Bacteroides xylanisolvens SD CC 1b TaxID=702447 RepID=W6P5R6_9BACE|nr:hypothetical protein BN890_9100 [Bacteroides xylanisolvens SD CC 1b]